LEDLPPSVVVGSQIGTQETQEIPTDDEPSQEEEEEEEE
jgi:hypothetical protein